MIVNAMNQKLAQSMALIAILCIFQGCKTHTFAGATTSAESEFLDLFPILTSEELDKIEIGSKVSDNKNVVPIHYFFDSHRLRENGLLICDTVLRFKNGFLYIVYKREKHESRYDDWVIMKKQWIKRDESVIRTGNPID